MKKIIYTCFLYLILQQAISLSCFSQVVQQWATPLYPSADTGSSSVSMALDDSGYVYVIGHAWDNTVSYSDFLTGKYDPVTGVVLWSDIYSDTTGYEDYLYTISIDDSSNVYVSGLTSVSSNNAPKTIKYNSNGIQQWIVGNGYGGGKNTLEDDNLFVQEGDSIKQYDLNGVPQWSTSMFGTSMITIALDGVILASDKNKNIYIAGRHPISVNPPFEQSIGLKKYDSTGTFKWEKEYHPTSGMDNLYSMTMDDSASVYLFGTQDWQNNPAYTLAKYDSAGNQKWAKSYSAPFGAAGHDVIADKNHNVYVCGRTIHATTIDYSIIKYDLNGNLKWIVPYDSAMSSSFPNSFLALDTLGNIYLTCAKRVGGTTSDITTIKLDTAGNIKWEIRYNQTATGSESPSEILVGKDMSVYVTGTSGGKLVTIKYSQATGINELINENDFIISPNPSMGIFTVKSNNKIQTIEIINLMGEKIYQSTNQQINNSQIDLSNQPNGIYLLQINSENGFLIRKGIISK